MSMTIEQIHTERPVTNTFHNIIQTLSIKINSGSPAMGSMPTTRAQTG